MILRWLAHLRIALNFIIRLFLLLLLLLISCIILVLNNESLTREALFKASDYIPGLTLVYSQGTLWRGLQIQQLHYQQEAVDVQINQALLSVDALNLLRGRLIIRQLETDGLRVQINSSSEDTDTNDEAFSLPEILTPVHIGIQQLTLRNSHIVYGEQAWPVDALNLSAFWHHARVQITQGQVTSGDYRLDIAGWLTMQKDWPLDIGIRWQAPLPQQAADILDAQMATGSIQASGSVMALAIQHHTEKPLILSGDIQLKLFDTPLSFATSHQWQAITLHNDEQRILLEAGKLSLSGDLDQYRLLLETAVSVDEWPQLLITLDASGNDQAAQLQQLRIANNESTLQLQGSVSWQPDIRWQLQGVLDNINPAMLLADLPGAINARLNSEGHVCDTLTASLNLTDLSGTLRGHALRGHSNSTIEKSANMNTDTRLQLGDNLLSASGSLGDNLAMQLQLHGQDLAQLWPDLSGQLQLQATLSGSRNSPLLHADMQASALRFNDISIDAITLDVDTQNLTQTMQGQLTLQQLRLSGDTMLEQLTFSGNGNLQQHSLLLAAQHPQIQIATALQGKLDNQQWLATLTQLDIYNQMANHWQLQQNTNITLGTLQAELQTLCLQQQDGQGLLCLSAAQQQDNLDAELQLQYVTLAPLAGFIGADAEVQGMLNAGLSLKKRGDIITASVNADAGTGHIRLLEDGEESLRMPWQELSLNAELDNTRYNAQLNLILDTENHLTQTLRGDAGNAGTVNGNLALRFNRLQWLELFTPLRDIKGELVGDLAISGLIENPDITGDVTLQQASLNIPEAGLVIDNIGVTLAANANGLITLNGKLYSAGKPLMLEGQADRTQVFPWPMHIHVFGDDVLVLNRSEAVVRVDPDINVVIANQLITVRGKVNVRQATLELRELPTSAVSLSSDTVIVGDEQNTARWQLDNDITIVLGDKVSVQGMGLNARFTGDVRIEDKPQRPLSLSGVVRIEDGRYRAYGQNLRIERGILYFQGPPDDPGLDVLATRTLNTYSVKAGLEIGGTLKNPRSRVFAEPAMDETEAMAWLLTGKPLSGASENDGNAILQAIAVYGIEQGDFITGRLNDTLGLEVGFDTEGETNEAAFMLGKQLSPRLYLRYSVSLFESISTFMLRYSLSQYVNLETRTSGQNQSIDLIYRRER